MTELIDSFAATMLKMRRLSFDFFQIGLVAAVLAYLGSMLTESVDQYFAVVLVAAIVANAIVRLSMGSHNAKPSDRGGTQDAFSRVTLVSFVMACIGMLIGMFVLCYPLLEVMMNPVVDASDIQPIMTANIMAGFTGFNLMCALWCLIAWFWSHSSDEH